MAADAPSKQELQVQCLRPVPSWSSVCTSTDAARWSITSRLCDQQELRKALEAAREEAAAASQLAVSKAEQQATAHEAAVQALLQEHDRKLQVTTPAIIRATALQYLLVQKCYGCPAAAPTSPAP